MEDPPPQCLLRSPFTTEKYSKITQEIKTPEQSCDTNGYKTNNTFISSWPITKKDQLQSNER